MRPPTGQSLPACDLAVDKVDARAYRIPTPAEESDATLKWGSTVIIVVLITGRGHAGLGYTYTDPCAARFITSTLGPLISGACVAAPPEMTERLNSQVRNIGLAGIAAAAISAVDIALWDLAARVSGVSLARMLGALTSQVPGYGSGGFTSLDATAIRHHMDQWMASGVSAVKMKVGRHPRCDRARVEAARQSVGDDVSLMVDANGAYNAARALDAAREFAEYGVSWFEEPCPMTDVEGLRRVHDRAPHGMEIAAGEYGWRATDFAALHEVAEVDVLQADVTRCGGVTGVLRLAGYCNAAQLPLSAHCAPAISSRVFACAPTLRHIELFEDHLRVERLLFDGMPASDGGELDAGLSAPGHGLTLREADARKFQL